MRLKRLWSLAVAGLFLIPGYQVQAASPKFDPPGAYYLALGDSLAFGYQEIRFLDNLPTEDPAHFDTGYVSDLAGMLEALDPRLQTVNYGCPGETTVSFLDGPCAYQAAGFPLHNGYPGSSQMAAALRFLDAQPGRVGLITLDLGVNDVLSCVYSPSPPPGCIATEIQKAALNMAAILGRLRRAAPASEIIVMQYYNPLAVADPATNQEAIALNDALAADAAAVRARLADAFTPFNLAPEEPATLCELTLFCTPLQDIHASDAGYEVIAEQFWKASGYSRL